MKKIVFSVLIMSSAAVFASVCGGTKDRGHQEQSQLTRVDSKQDLLISVNKLTDTVNGHTTALIPLSELPSKVDALAAGMDRIETQLKENADITKLNQLVAGHATEIVSLNGKVGDQDTEIIGLHKKIQRLRYALGVSFAALVALTCEEAREALAGKIKLPFLG